MSYKLLIALSLLTFVGCVKDQDMEPYGSSDSQLFTLSIESFTDEVVASSRSTTSDISIDRGYLFFYDSSTGSYKGYESVANLNLSQSDSYVSFETSSEYSISDKIIAVFNHDESLSLPDDLSSITDANLNSYFPLSANYLTQVEAEMNSGSYSLGMPMYLNDFTDSDRAVREVYRSVARMELFIKEELTIEHDSHIHSIGAADLEFVLANAASAGSVGVGSSPSYTKESCFDVDSFDGVFPYNLTEYSTSAEDTSNKIYLQSFPYSTLSVEGKELGATTFDEDRFAIILKHNDTNIYTDTPTAEARYYKLNLLDKATSTYFDVECNHSYRVVITAVNSRGYETIKEAYEMPPSNIEYEIYDDKGGLTYSNGQYAISMDEILSYDEILVYGSNETTLEFNNIRYVLPDGGQMEGATFDTNEVLFNVLSSTDGLAVATTSDFSFDSSGSSVLTSDGKSILVTLSGEGECTIQLKIKLGNLDMGRDEITIKKIATNGDGDGSFDAHPNHVELENQLFVEGSWQSDDIDFGARASSDVCDDCGDGGVVIYMGENATPTGYRTMDGYVSGQSSVNSYPVFSGKTRKGYYSYIDSEGETRKVMIQLDQLAPFYLGHFGNKTTNGSSYYYNGLICEKIEEISRYSDWEGYNATDGIMEWSKAQQTYYKGTIWGDYLGLGDRYHNLVDGLGVTRNIVENNTEESILPSAAHYCYMKNDINGNGVIDSDEPIVWYLPAQNQMLAMWVSMNIFDNEIELFQLNNKEGDSNIYYWTCSEVDAIYDYTYTTPSSFSSHAIKFNMLEGQADYETKNNGWDAGQCHIRCVRCLD